MLRSVLGTALRTSSLIKRTNGARLFASIRPLGPKNPAPPFKGNAVVNGEIKEISYADYTGSGRWVILFFYPLDFTFVCPTEIIAFNDRSDEFAALNTQLIACSCDSHFSHLAWIQTPRKEGGLGEMKIPVLADFNKNIASDFGVLDEGAGLSYRYAVHTLHHPILNSLGFLLYDKAFSGLFLIDPKGVIRHCVVNDLPVGRSVDETLRTLKAFQYFEKHGEVCPADWEEDQPSINTTSPKEYFSKVNK